MNKLDRDVLERVTWTFVQAFLGAWIVSPLPLTKVAFIAAFAAGISAVKNYVKQTL